MAATRATTRLARYRALQARMPDPSRVVNVACPGLVDRIEKGVFADDAFDDLFEAYFSEFEGSMIDGIVLGCTHYVFIKEAFKRYAASHFLGEARLFDGNLATARQLVRVLEARHMLRAAGEGNLIFQTSGKKDFYEPLFRRLLTLS